MKKKVKTAWAQVERLHRKYDITSADGLTKMTPTEQRSYAAHCEIIKSYVTDDRNFDYTDVIEATTRASWRAEYLKRKFFPKSSGGASLKLSSAETEG